MAFCAACAERGSSIVRLLGRPADISLFDQALELDWRVVGGDLDDEASAEIIEGVEEWLSEEGTEEDDADGQQFYAEQALMLSVNTLSVFLNPRAESAELSGQTMESILSSFDFKLGDGRPVITAHDETPPTGDLQRIEQEAQAQVLTTPLVGDELRNLCTLPRERVHNAVVEVAARSGWSLNSEIG